MISIRVPVSGGSEFKIVSVGILPLSFMLSSPRTLDIPIM